MISSLHVSNYVLIDSLDLDFSSGLTAITGETGSGKSILLGALSLLLGAKSDREDIRKGKDRAEISGVFTSVSSEVRKWCDDKEITVEDDCLIIRRVIKAEGRGIYTVNGSPVSVREGEELGEMLVDFSSQHSHHSLMKKEVLVSLLDDFSQTGELAEEYRESYRLMNEKKKLLEETRRLVDESHEEADYLAYCVREIESASLVAGEEEKLRDKLRREAESEVILSSIGDCQSGLFSACSLVSSSLSSLRKAEKKDSDLCSLSERLESAQIEIEDIHDTLREYSSSFSFSEDEIASMNERLSVIQRVRRRYGGSEESALRTLSEYREKLSLIEDGSERIDKLEKELEKITSETSSLACRLSVGREKGASLFSRKIEETLHLLAMENAVFTISVTRDGMGPLGQDKIEYLIAPNRGEKTRAIQDSASGGELSRILLAIKASGKSSFGCDTMLFDEIDSGLGGVVAQYVARILKKLSLSSQVITITHLAQIASKADCHLLVEKETKGERTVSSIREVTGEERKTEIARLLSGDISPTSLLHAGELLGE